MTLNVISVFAFRHFELKDKVKLYYEHALEYSAMYIL